MLNLLEQIIQQNPHKTTARNNAAACDTNTIAVLL